jgi:mRNA interferase MazF
LSLINRGDIFDAEIPGFGHRPVLVVTRQVAIPILSAVTVAIVTSTIRGIQSEVRLNSEHGLKQSCVANCDNLFTLTKSRLHARRGTLGVEDLDRLDSALRFALQLD